MQADIYLATGIGPVALMESTMILFRDVAEEVAGDAVGSSFGAGDVEILRLDMLLMLLALSCLRIPSLQIHPRGIIDVG